MCRKLIYTYFVDFMFPNSRKFLKKIDKFLVVSRHFSQKLNHRNLTTLCATLREQPSVLCRLYVCLRAVWFPPSNHTDDRTWPDARGRENRVRRKTADINHRRVAGHERIDHIRRRRHRRTTRLVPATSLDGPDTAPPRSWSTILYHSGAPRRVTIIICISIPVRAAHLSRLAAKPIGYRHPPPLHALPSTVTPLRAPVSYLHLNEIAPDDALSPAPPQSRAIIRPSLVPRPWPAMYPNVASGGGGQAVALRLIYKLAKR